MSLCQLVDKESFLRGYLCDSSPSAALIDDRQNCVKNQEYVEAIYYIEHAIQQVSRLDKYNPLIFSSGILERQQFIQPKIDIIECGLMEKCDEKYSRKLRSTSQDYSASNRVDCGDKVSVSANTVNVDSKVVGYPSGDNVCHSLFRNNPKIGKANNSPNDSVKQMTKPLLLQVHMNQREKNSLSNVSVSPDKSATQNLIGKRVASPIHRKGKKRLKPFVSPPSLSRSSHSSRLLQNSFDGHAKSLTSANVNCNDAHGRNVVEVISSDSSDEDLIFEW